MDMVRLGVRRVSSGRRPACLIAAAGLLWCLPVLSPAPASASRSVPAGVCSWSIVKAPTVDVGDNDLRAVAVLSQTDAWAVGYSTDAIGFAHALALHWDGSSWTAVDMPVPYESSRLFTVTALAANDVWAGGDFYDDTKSGALTEHWDGHAWTIFKARSDGQILGMAAASADDVWAVGSHYKNTYDRPFARHWDGARWETVRIPFVIQHGWLETASVISSGDVWAAGQPNLTYHWDGSAWQEMPGPGGEGITFFNALATVASADVWAIGNDDRHAFARHWDGSAWTLTPMPHAPNAHLNGAVANGPDDVWAVGSDGFLHPYTAFTLAMHWDGSTWAIVDTPNPASKARTRAILRGVSADSSGLWAVGQFRTHGRWVTLIERCG